MNNYVIQYIILLKDVLFIKLLRKINSLDFR